MKRQLRSCGFFVLACASTSTVARAQTVDACVEAVPFAGLVVHDGRLDLQSGVWTPPAEGLANVVYANTCLEDAFVDGSLATTVFVDEGRLPSTSSPTPFVGPLDRYHINAFTFGYTTRALDPSLAGPGARVRVRFFTSYAACAPLSLIGPASATFDLVSLPASQTAGELTGHIVTIELRDAAAFCLLADGDESFDDDPLLDGFGVALEIVDETHGSAGFLLAGPVPRGCPVGDGTIFGDPRFEGSGLSNFNFMRRENVSPGCINFGPGFFAGLYFALESDLTDVCAEPGTAFCFGVGCPCGNDDPSAGCAHSESGGARLLGAGTSEITRDDLVLLGSNLPRFTPCVFFMAPDAQTLPFGSGLLCVAPGPPQAGQGGIGFVRFPPTVYASEFGVATLGPGIVQLSAPRIQPGGTWNFQVWYRNGFAPCGPAFNLSNAYGVVFR